MMNIIAIEDFINFCDSMIIDIDETSLIAIETPFYNITISDNDLKDIVNQLRKIQITEKDISEHVWKYHINDLPERQVNPGRNSWFTENISSKLELSQYISNLTHKCDMEIAKMLKQKKEDIVVYARDTKAIGKIRYKPLSEKPTIYDCHIVRLVFRAKYNGTKAEIRFINAYPVRKHKKTYLRHHLR